MIQIEDQMELAAELILKNDLKVIQVFPLKAYEGANSNVSRRILLAHLLNDKEAQGRYIDNPKQIRIQLEQKAAAQGYELMEVNPDDYV